ncbi:hypothetical protein GCM10010515_36180 [Streptomyces fructofermentans]|uniref:DUF4177 domain-containing protein n=7 Tax=Streptomyces TaxID=1883 RepID=A0A918NEW5_9ACTN|nr:hypothetical protein GCM10010515_36180 [Streptomyces fructofermentans]
MGLPGCPGRHALEYGCPGRAPPSPPRRPADPRATTPATPYAARDAGPEAARGLRGERPGPAATVALMTKWEYATVPLLVHATKQILDTWGEDGWELVQVVPGPNNPEQLVAYLKRERAA